MTLQTALRQGTKLLEDAGVIAPRLTSEVLLSHALQRDRSYLYAHDTDRLTELAWIHYGRYLHERLQGKPTQYITHTQEFYGRDFLVTPDVLIPRPETEHVIEAALARLRPGDTVLDVGAGSGAIAVTLALESAAQVYACDLSRPALQIAATNAARLNAPVHFFQGDLATAIRPNSLHLLVSNPPYVPQLDAPSLQREVRDWEPHLALFAGPTGLDVYERLIPQAQKAIKSGGWLIFELGHNSLAPVQDLLSSWSQTEVIQDLAGIPRVIAASRSPYQSE